MYATDFAEEQSMSTSGISFCMPKGKILECKTKCCNFLRFTHYYDCTKRVRWLVITRPWRSIAFTSHLGVSICGSVIRTYTDRAKTITSAESLTMESID